MTYKTSQIARLIGIHSNTVRLYEELGLVSKPGRQANGYRVYSDLHLEQFRFARLALRAEVIQNGLRKMAIKIIRTVAAGDYGRAIGLAGAYLALTKREQENAEEAVAIAGQLLTGAVSENKRQLTRKEAAELLQVTIDTLRNWELNGLLNVKRKQNGYRVYNDEDIRRLKVIRALRLAGYSLAAILRLLLALDEKPGINLRQALDTPEATEDIVSVCDRLLTSLNKLEADILAMLRQLEQMKKCHANPPL